MSAQPSAAAQRLTLVKAEPHASVLRAAGLMKRYRKRTVVSDVSLTVESGEVVGLLGPNGAGKTTCFYMILGLVPIDAGSVTLDGEDLTHLPIYRRSRLGLSYLPQEASIFRKLTVEQNIRAVLELQGVEEEDVQARLEQLMDDLHVGHLRASPALALSGGERRRVEIARALATSPRFILLDEPFSALAFKIATDPFVGKLAFFRVYSGKVTAGSYILNSSTGDKERVARIVRMHADKREDVTEVDAGDIAAIVGLKGTTTGNTLCDAANPIILESITFPEPPVSIAIEPKTKADQEKMSMALQRLAEEDPTFRIKVDHETGQTIISGMGELHLEIIVDRMKREFTVEANVGQPQVAYRETIRKDGTQSEGKFIRQSGGRGQYGHVWLRLSQNEAGKGFEFINSIKGGAVPSEYIPAIKAGIEEAMSNGVIAGYPVVDIKAELYDGSFHEVDSSEMAFKIAGSMALQEGVKNSNPVLLEPIMKIVVVTPEDFMGDVIGDLNSKRGRVEQMEDLQNGIKQITAYVPLGEMFGYTTNLRSSTQGRASSSMELDHYADVPGNVAQDIIAKSGK